MLHSFILKPNIHEIDPSSVQTHLATGGIVVRVRFIFSFLFLALNNEYYAFEIMKLHTPNHWLTNI